MSKIMIRIKSVLLEVGKPLRIIVVEPTRRLYEYIIMTYNNRVYICTSGAVCRRGLR